MERAFLLYSAGGIAWDEREAKVAVYFYNNLISHMTVLS